MRKYLLQNNLKIKKEIFRLKNIKITQRNKYETFECDACTMENESQLKMQKSENEIPSYDRIFYGKVKEQIEIARSFRRSKS